MKKILCLLLIFLILLSVIFTGCSRENKIFSLSAVDFYNEVIKELELEKIEREKKVKYINILVGNSSEYEELVMNQSMIDLYVSTYGIESFMNTLDILYDEIEELSNENNIEKFLFILKDFLYDYQNEFEYLHLGLLSQNNGTYYQENPTAPPVEETSSQTGGFNDASNGMEVYYETKEDKTTVTYYGDFAVAKIDDWIYDKGKYGWKNGVFYDELASWKHEISYEVYYQGQKLQEVSYLEDISNTEMFFFYGAKNMYEICLKNEKYEIKVQRLPENDDEYIVSSEVYDKNTKPIEISENMLLQDKIQEIVKSYLFECEVLSVEYENGILDEIYDLKVDNDEIKRITIGWAAGEYEEVYSGKVEYIQNENKKTEFFVLSLDKSPFFRLFSQETEKHDLDYMIHNFSAYGDSGSFDYFIEHKEEYDKLTDYKIFSILAGKSWMCRYASIVYDEENSSEFYTFNSNGTTNGHFSWKTENDCLLLGSNDFSYVEEYEVRDLGNGYYCLYRSGETYRAGEPYTVIWELS